MKVCILKNLSGIGKFFDDLRLQEKLIWRKNWNILIVLDAMRFDYFAVLYRLFFDGKLMATYSPSYYTIGWIKHISAKKVLKDVVYISANPYISTKYRIEHINLKEFFYDIIDVWNYCWDETFGTVPHGMSQT